jgi:hypothetical protein
MHERDTPICISQRSWARRYLAPSGTPKCIAQQPDNQPQAPVSSSKSGPT